MTERIRARGEAFAQLLGRLDRRILLGFLGFALLASIFLGVAEEVGEGDTLGFDRWLLTALRVPGHPDLTIGPAWLAKAPPDCAAKPYAMARPSPVPLPTSLVVKKGSVARASVAASTPTPVSRRLRQG